MTARLHPEAITYRPPTLDEAVSFLLMPSNDSYRKQCIELWRERLGKAFADQVLNEMTKKGRPIE